MVLWALINVVIEKCINFFVRHKAIAAIALIIIYFCLIGAAVSEFKKPLQEKYEIAEYKIHIVEQGDTLWDISVENAPKHIRIEEYIELIKEASEKANVNLFPGEILSIPIFGEGDNN